MKHCCVIGGSGFIGQHLVNVLLASGRRVSVIGRGGNPPADISPHVEYHSGDIGEQAFLKRALRDVNEIVDLAYASVPKTSFDDPVQDILSNLPAAVSLLQTASLLSLDKFVVVSSGGVVYGNVHSLPITEAHPTNPISPYGITKLAVEKYSLMYWRDSALPVVCVRPGNAYGERQRPFAGQGFIATAIASVLAKKELAMYGESGTIRDYIHVSDLSYGIVAALDRGRVGHCYNIGTGIGKSNKEVLEALAKLSRPNGLEPIVRVLAARPFDVPANVLDSTKLRIDTGWVPQVSFDEGLERTWRWFVDQTANVKQPDSDKAT